MNQPFDFDGRISEQDRWIACNYLGSLYRPPDLVIAPAGHGEYLFRWYVVPKNDEANVYFHVQTKGDPHRPLHDHPWDSTSVILAGGYEEVLDETPGTDDGYGRPPTHQRKPGDTIHRPATWAHRLILPPHAPYSMSLFLTGPKVRDWGFWTDKGWVDFRDMTVETAGKSQWKESMA